MFWLVLTGGFLALTVGLLLVPVHVSVSLRRDVHVDTCVCVNWGFFRFSSQLGGGKGKPSRRKKGLEKPPRHRWAAAGSVLRVPGLGRWVMRLIRRTARAIEVLRLTLEMRVGLDDPADTGRLFGIIGPVSLWINRFPKWEVGLDPDFDRATVSGRAEAVLTIHPARVAGAVLLFVCSPTMFRLGWVLAWSQWKR